MILEKVRRYFPNKSEEEVETISFSLTNQAELLKNFQHLLNLKYVGQVVVDSHEAKQGEHRFLLQI